MLGAPRRVPKVDSTITQMPLQHTHKDGEREKKKRRLRIFFFNKIKLQYIHHRMFFPSDPRVALRVVGVAVEKTLYLETSLKYYKSINDGIQQCVKQGS